MRQLHAIVSAIKDKQIDKEIKSSLVGEWLEEAITEDSGFVFTLPQ